MLYKFRKYENRKLYNTTTHEYNNLDQILELVMSGNEVEALDKKGDYTKQLLVDLYYLQLRKSSLSVNELYTRIHSIKPLGFSEDK